MLKCLTISQAPLYRESNIILHLQVGLYHDFSAGLVIGGKDVKSEAAHMCRTNILVCTPGRLLQHMDETSYFDASSLQILGTWLKSQYDRINSIPHYLHHTFSVH